MESRPLYLLEERIKTFKMWPFSNKDKCNVRNMAEAGFYSMATCKEDADAAKCFLCGKEMDGWEPSDDPWTEHRDHAPQCAFVQIGKSEDEVLLLEFLSKVKQYMINESKRLTEVVKQKVEDEVKSTRRRLRKY